MGDLLDFQKIQIIGARLAEVSVTITAQLFGVLWTTVFTIMTEYEQWQDFINEEE